MNTDCEDMANRSFRRLGEQLDVPEELPQGQLAGGNLVACFATAFR